MTLMSKSEFLSKKKSYEEELADLNQREAELQKELELEKAKERIRKLEEQISLTRRSHQSDYWWENVPTCIKDSCLISNKPTTIISNSANISPREVFIQSFLKDIENGLW